ncbi:MAG TPA: hypothetical protein VNZ01_00155 [Solirubrobacteraceae bacterium]|nr:hypothetical protein [Solirubrobacteraceae bacterium]
MHLRHRSPDPPGRRLDDARDRKPWGRLSKGGGAKDDAATDASAAVDESVFSQAHGTFIAVEYEAIPGEGEDAEPLRLLGPSDVVVLGVFDGLGGAGGARYEIEGMERKGAYIASRLARGITLQEAERRLVAPVTDLASALNMGTQFAAGLAERLQLEFHRVASSLAGEPSSLRSSMVRVLPTTAALVIVWPSRDGRGVGPESRLGCAVWAGDSRIYVLSPSRGLVQVSSDDARVKSDALASLESDPPIDNCISASRDFRLNTFAWELNEPSIVFAATDGCFGYLPTPAHFEIALLDAMSGAATSEDWQRGLAASISSVARDDASLVAATLGFEDFNALRAAFEPRRAYVQKEFVEPYALRQDVLLTADRELAALKQRRDELAEARSQCAKQLWQRYRPGYEQLVAAQLRDQEPAP